MHNFKSLEIPFSKHLKNLQEGRDSQPALCALVAWGVRTAGVMGTPGTTGSGARQGWGAAQGLWGGLCVSPWMLCHLTLHTPQPLGDFICIRRSFHLVGNCSQHTNVKKCSFLCCLNSAGLILCFSGFQ